MSYLLLLLCNSGYTGKRLSVPIYVHCHLIRYQDTFKECQFCYTDYCSKWPALFCVYDKRLCCLFDNFTSFSCMRSSDTTIRRKSSSLVCDFCRRPVILLLPPIINYKEAWDLAASWDSLVERELQIQQSIAFKVICYSAADMRWRPIHQRVCRGPSCSGSGSEVCRKFRQQDAPVWSSMTDGQIRWFPMTQHNIFSENLCWEVGFSGNMWIGRHTVNWTAGAIFKTSLHD